MKVILAGTPDFASNIFAPLIKRGKFDIAAVLANSAKAGDRGRVTDPPAAVLAKKYGVPLLQFDKISSTEGIAALKTLDADIMLTAAFGQILSDEALSLFPKGVLNVHGSLLPKYRGASPIQSAILAGDTVTGITIMRTVKDVDAGDILLKEEIPILEQDTAGSMFEKLAALGAKLAADALKLVLTGKDTYTPQKHAEATFTKMLKKQDGKLDFFCPVRRLELQVRAYNPWPGTFFSLFGKNLKIFRLTSARACNILLPCNSTQPGEVLVANAKDGWFVQCGDGIAELCEVQPEGGRRMSAKQFLQGRVIPVGTVIN